MRIVENLNVYMTSGLRLVAESPSGFTERVIEPLKRWLFNWFGQPIKTMHEPVDRWLGSLPLSVGLGCAIGLFVIALIWVWTLKREFVFRGAPDDRPWRDLRVWATIVILPYIAVYLIFGR